MTEIATGDITLKWDVFVTKRQGLNRDLPPGKEQWMWVPTSATLIYGQRDAVLVDAFLTVEQAHTLVDWVAASGQIPERLVIAEELKGNVIDLEGRDLVVVEVGHTDTDHTTCLHVPSVGLVVAGDAAYNDVHLYLVESNAQTRREWISALDTIESLNPRAVIAGHKRPGNDDSPKIIQETRQYIRDFERVAEMTTTARELYDKMLELYPDRANPGSLWGSARGVKGAS